MYEGNELDVRITQKMLESIPKERLLNTFAKGAAYFSFRGGPVEDMHVNGKLTDEDMEVLNKYMVDKLGILFKLLLDGKNMDAYMLALSNTIFCSHWDNPDVSDLEKQVRLSNRCIASFYGDLVQKNV